MVRELFGFENAGHVAALELTGMGGQHPLEDVEKLQGVTLTPHGGLSKER